MQLLISLRNRTASDRLLMCRDGCDSAVFCNREKLYASESAVDGNRDRSAYVSMGWAEEKADLNIM